VAAYVHQLAVKDGYHGQDIGGHLMGWASQQAAERKKQFLRIDFPLNNTGLKTYYEKHGFQFVKNREIHAPHATYTVALYERPTN
jgi:ribosomal protein S18 acetylase RimI-like enzyme